MTEDRVRLAQHEIQHDLPQRPEYVVDTSEFEQVKARLDALEHHRKIEDPNRPTLRRRTNPDSQDSGDDRPTLKRR